MGTRPNGSPAYRTPNDVPGHFANCPHCDELIVVGEMMGCPYAASRFSITHREALCLSKFGHAIYHIRVSMIRHRLIVADWLPPRKPAEGRLYTQHVCHIWR